MNVLKTDYKLYINLERQIFYIYYIFKRLQQQQKNIINLPQMLLKAHKSYV